MVRDLEEFNSHFWNASDDRYLHFGWPFDVAASRLILGSDELTRLPLASVNALGACLVDALLCLEAFAVEVAESGNDSFHLQEEVRHRFAMARYRDLRWGEAPYHCPTLHRKMADLLASSKSDELALITDIVVEPLAIALACFFHDHAADPLLVRMSAFLVSDEVMHRQPEPAAVASSALGPIGDAVIAILDALFADCRTAAEGLDLSRIALEYCPDIASSAAQMGMPADTVAAIRRFVPGSTEPAKRRISRIASDATAFLTGLRSSDYPTPNPALAVEWLAAGLRSAHQYFEEVGR